MITIDDLIDTYGPFKAEEEEPVSFRTLNLSFSEETDDQATNTTMTLEDGKTEYLPTIMAAFEKMLHAMGFDYVRLVKLSEDHSLYAYETN